MAGYHRCYASTTQNTSFLTPIFFILDCIDDFSGGHKPKEISTPTILQTSVMSTIWKPGLFVSSFLQHLHLPASLRPGCVPWSAEAKSPCITQGGQNSCPQTSGISALTIICHSYFLFLYHNCCAAVEMEQGPVDQVYTVHRLCKSRLNISQIHSNIWRSLIIQRQHARWMESILKQHDPSTPLW